MEKPIIFNLSDAPFTKNKKNKYGKKHGYWVSHYFNGNVWWMGKYKNGKKHGYWRIYYSNGKIRYTGKFLNGKRHGRWEEYDCHGAITKKEYHVD